MPRGEKLFTFLASLMMRNFYGIVITRFESGKVTHVETETRRMWRYQDLPREVIALSDSSGHPPDRPHVREGDSQKLHR